MSTFHWNCEQCTSLRLRCAWAAAYRDFGKSLKMSKKCPEALLGRTPEKCQKNVLEASKMSLKCPKNVLQTSLRHFLDILEALKRPKGGGGFAAAPLWCKYGFKGVHWDPPSNWVLSRGSTQFEGVHWVSP